MIIRFTCENGHRLKAKSKYQGRKTTCPNCKSVVEIPKQSRDVTDSSVMRFIDGSGQFTLQPTQTRPISGSSATNERSRQCPRCFVDNPTNARVCRHCDLYLMTTGTTWDAALKQAKRFVKENRKPTR